MTILEKKIILAIYYAGRNNDSFKNEYANIESWSDSDVEIHYSEKSTGTKDSIFFDNINKGLLSI